MIIALFALAVLMIVGGVASVVQGFPFVRLESGMAMTVAGATTASAGAVVLGLATVASHLRALGRRLAERRLEIPVVEERRIDASTEGAPEPAGSEPMLPMPGPGDRPLRQRPSLGGPEGREFGMSDLAMGGMGVAAGLGAAGLGATGTASLTKSGMGPHGRGTEPTFVLPPEADLPAPPSPEAVEPFLPDLLPPAEPEAPATEIHPRPAESQIAQTEPAPSSVETVPSEDHRTLALFDTGIDDAAAEPVRLYPSLDTMADITPEPTPPVLPAPPALEDKPEVVGTYASGGNTYVMYANGSIEAETPRGRFSFDSLDELKAFVEAGGETDARGAA